jgi:repressor LexA
MSNFAKRLNYAMRVRGITTQTELVEATGISKGAISSYLEGRYEPKQQNLYLIAKALRVNPAWLMGKDVPMDPIPENAVPFKIKKVPLLGKISAGEPIMAYEECEEYVVVNGGDEVDFCLRVTGDSMIDARIHDGDLAFVKRQPCVDNGEIAVVMIEDEVTLKRFYKTPNGIILKPENSKYEPLFFSERESKKVLVLGKVVLLQTRL